MSNTLAFEKGTGFEAYNLGVICASAITNTKLAYRLSATDHETVVLCGDNELIGGFPDRKAAIGEAFTLRMVGHLVGVASEEIAINEPITSAANGKLRVAVFGTDHIQGWAESNAAADEPVTIRKGF